MLPYFILTVKSSIRTQHYVCACVVLVRRLKFFFFKMPKMVCVSKQYIEMGYHKIFKPSSVLYHKFLSVTSCYFTQPSLQTLSLLLVYFLCFLMNESFETFIDEMCLC